MNKTLRITTVTVLAAGAAGAVLAYIVKDQIARRQRDLFSPHAWRRLAALGHMARERASVDHINLLRDFLAWEPRKMLRERARAIVLRMQDEVSSPALQEAGSGAV